MPLEAARGDDNVTYLYFDFELICIIHGAPVTEPWGGVWGGARFQKKIQMTVVLFAFVCNVFVLENLIFTQHQPLNTVGALVYLANVT